MTVQIVANPVSGSGQAPETARRLRSGLEAHDHSTDLFITRAPGDAEERAAEIGPDHCIISVGGDGTIREVVNGVDLSAPPRLMVCPTGTGNVLAGELCMPRTVGKLVNLLDRGLTRWMDVGVCEEHRFLSMAGIGFDARVVQAFHERRDQAAGMWTYTQVGLRTFFGHREVRVNVYVDDEKHAEAVPFVQVASVRNYGGPLLFSPFARPDRGTFAVSWLETSGRAALFRLMVTASLGVPQVNPDYRTVRGGRVRIEPVKGTPALQLDGDPGPEEGRRFRLRPRAVPFLTPIGSSLPG